MLNPLVAAQQKIYTAQQNINNALDDSYHRRTTEIKSTEFNKYVTINTVRKGDFEQDKLLLNSKSNLNRQKVYSEQQTAMSSWADTWLSGKEPISKSNNTPDADEQINWFESGRIYAESQINSLKQNINADTMGVTTILTALARTNDTSMPGVNKDNIKDVQFQLLGDLSKYISFTSRYDGEQLSVSLVSGEPLVQGSMSAIFQAESSKISISFQGAKFNVSTDILGGSISATSKSIDGWQSLVDKIVANRNDVAAKMNGWNNSFGAAQIYTMDTGSISPSVYNTGDISMSLGFRSNSSNSVGNIVIDSTGNNTGSNGAVDNISAFKLVNNGGVFELYSQSNKSDNWTLDSSDSNLNVAIASFNNKNHSVTINSATINTASASGDIWEWHASSSVVTKTGSPVTGLTVGVSRTDTMDSNSKLLFVETTPGYSSAAGLSLSINNSGMLTGFPNGSVVKVIKPDGSINSVNITPATAPLWSENDIYEYNGNRWKASGDSAPGAAWTVQPSVKTTNDNNKNIDGLESNLLSDYQRYVGLNTKNANNAFKIQQTYSDASQAEWQSQNGVNLDEEALELTKAKQWYESLAKAQAIQTGLWNTLLESI